MVRHSKAETFVINTIYIYAVLEVGWDEAGWHPVSFRKASKPSLCLLTVAKSSRRLFSRFEIIPLFSSVKPLLALLLFYANSNVNMRRIAIMKELHFTLSV
jgi:hypothetical protein